MSPPEPRVVKLDGTLSEDQVRIVRDAVVGLLIGRTGDLVYLDDRPDPKGELGEIAALSRLAAGLELGAVEVPDRIAEDVMSRLAAGADEIDERQEIRRRHEAAIAEHDALHAFAALLSARPTPGRSFQVSPGDLTDAQLAILREEATDWLAAKAEDLPRAADGRAPSRREVEEIAALGRLVSGLGRGEPGAPDRVLRDLIARTANDKMGLEELDELKEEYEREMAEHEAWRSLLARFDDPGPVASDPEEDEG